jgi:phosphate uptake regulator
MKKRLTAQGPKDRKSYTVTLPIDWVKEEGLDAVKEVELEMVGHKIVISPYKETEKVTFINGENYRHAIVKAVQGLYRMGVDEIKLQFESNDILEETSDLIEQVLIGYEIIEQKKDYILIKEITKESEEDFKVIFRRIFLLLIELSESENVVQTRIVDKNVKKLINYCQRILVKKGHTDFQKTPQYYLTLDRLEKIGDEFLWLGNTKISKKKEQECLKEINLLLRAAYDLFYTFDAKKYSKAVQRSYELKNEIKLEEKVDVSAIHLHNLARTLNSLLGDIFTLKFKD